MAGVAVPIAAYGVYKFYRYMRQPSLRLDEIGDNFNGWRNPRKLTANEIKVAKRICDADDDELNFNDTDWDKATKVVDKVLKLLMIEIKSEAGKYKGIVIEEYIKQGSSREGLKIHAADEFDVLLKFRFDDFECEVVHMMSYGKKIPELAYLRVNKTMGDLSVTHSKLYTNEVFCEIYGDTFISTWALQEKVFKSIIATASDRVMNKYSYDKDTKDFRISLRTNPPSINIKIEITKNWNRESDYQSKTIDVDIVPGLLISENDVPDPTNGKRVMKCPTYAVFKWFTENHRSASGYEGKQLLWRLCSSGYEKHVIDIAQGKPEERHIVTALRVMKLYFRNMKQKAISSYQPPPQVVTVLRSYHLKHITFYCILFLRVINKVNLSCVDDALTYMVEFLGICLNEGKLPHFFHANSYIDAMFPSLSCTPRDLRYDLLQSKRGDSLNQARLSYRSMAGNIYAIIKRTSGTEQVVEQFRSYISSGRYFAQQHCQS